MSADSWCPAENYNDRGPNRASIARLASTSISSGDVALGWMAFRPSRDDPCAKIAALQPFPTGLTSIRYPLYSIAVIACYSTAPLTQNCARDTGQPRTRQTPQHRRSRLYRVRIVHQDAAGFRTQGAGAAFREHDGRSHSSFRQRPGVQVIEIGAKKFMCMGALPPQDHPHVFCDMGEDVEYVCPYCSRSIATTRAGA